jgi:hypothetical protein
MIARSLKAVFMFIILLSQLLLHQVISVEQVACTEKGFGQILISSVIHAVIWFLSSWMKTSVGWMAWSLHGFSFFSPSNTDGATIHVPLLTGLLPLTKSLMKIQACGLYNWNMMSLENTRLSRLLT